ncbi:hypothetical protein NIES2100_17290 [Calothrix sp. NIES-2100]|nr:hypothetical protein NIES2100_17290 [Calothrix sp. NIES-2100]
MSESAIALAIPVENRILLFVVSFFSRAKAQGALALDIENAAP